MALLTVREYEAKAAKIMDLVYYEYYAKGSDDEVTLRDNVEAFKRWRFRPRFLRNVQYVDISTSILGHPVSSPICIAPTAMQMLAHVDGEKATAAAAAKYRTLITLSTFSTINLEEIQKISSSCSPFPEFSSFPDAPLWLQLYVLQDLAITEKFIKRAESSGYKAIVLTIDTPFLGRRLADIRNGFALPSSLHLANFPSELGVMTQSEKRARGIQSNPISPHLKHSPTISKELFANFLNTQASPSLTWEETISWLRSVTKLPIVLKGIMTKEDAILAAKVGVDGILISNHGGRQLDGVFATIDVVEEIVNVLKGKKIEVYMDGGIRNGGDVLKALALGVSAVFVGRPILWGLAVDGQKGVENILSLFNEELRLSMALSGCRNLKEINRDLVAHINTIGKL